MQKLHRVLCEWCVRQRVCGKGQGLARCMQAPAGNCVTVHCDWRDMHAYLPCVASSRAASVYLPHLSNQGPVIPCALPTQRQRHDALRQQNVRPLHASAGCVCTDLEAHVLLQGSFKAVALSRLWMALPQKPIWLQLHNI